MNEDASLERRGRAHFHVALAGVFTVCLFPFVSVWAAMQQPARDTSGWRRRLAIFAVFDVVLLVLALVATTRGNVGDHEPPTVAVPRISSAPSKGERVPLFSQAPIRRPKMSAAELLDAAKGTLVCLAALAALAGLAARRKVPLRPIFVAMAANAGHALVSIVVSFALQKTIGPSLGAALLSMIAGGLTMLGIAVVGIRRSAPTPLPVDPAGTFYGWGLGIFYALTGTIRAAIIVMFATSILHLPNHSAADVFGMTPAWGVLGIGLFVVAGVILAPIAEECLFRGVLLPWLAQWMSPTLAIFVSASVFGIGHLFYGVSVLVPTAYGLALGAIRLRTGRLRASILLHGTLNAFATGVMLWMAR